MSIGPSARFPARHEFNRNSVRPSTAHQNTFNHNRWCKRMTHLALAELAKMFDHSLLQPTLTDADLDQGFAVARECNVASVCVKPYGVIRAAAALKNSGVLVGTVIGF